MNKIIISILFLLVVNLSASLVDDKLIEYKKGNPEKASKLYKKACNSGKMQGCINLGVLYFSGDGVEKNHKKAKKLFIKACKKRYLKACHYLGIIYMRGADGVEKNLKRAKNFYIYGCQRGYAPSCKQYNLIREKPEVVGSGKNVINSGYTYRPEVYGG